VLTGKLIEITASSVRRKLMPSALPVHQDVVALEDS
jgi:hypothetical protein